MRKNALARPVSAATRSSADAPLPLEPGSSASAANPPRRGLRIVPRAPQAEGWRASEPGPHTIRVRFDRPTSIRRIHLEFSESRVERLQEFTLAVVAAGRRRHIVRQQWTFSPEGSTQEVEDYTVNLPAVTALELHINPDRYNDQAFASLQALAIA
jgi:hypothetical protein